MHTCAVKRAVLLFVLVFWCADAKAEAQPDWAYPPVPNHTPSADPTPFSVPGSAQHYTQGQVDSGYEVADWYPDEHPPMPRVVAKGGKPPVRACAMCHLPTGLGIRRAPVWRGSRGRI